MNNAGEELHPFLTLAGLQATRKVVHLVSFCLQMYVIFLTSDYRVERERVSSSLQVDTAILAFV